MGLKVAPAASLYWSQRSVPHSPSSSSPSQTLINSSKQRRSFVGGPLFCRYKSPLFLGAHQSSKLYWSRSSGKAKVRIITRALTASLDSFSDKEFSKQIQELALRFQPSEDDDHHYGETPFADIVVSDSDPANKFLENLKPFDDDDDDDLPFDFRERDGMIIPANIEMKANSVEIPLSLRMIKRKKQWKAGESACCSSIKRAFSSMVFIIRELHSYTLHMREILFYEDLQGILASVQKEMHASFVWLFQKVFSHTPTLMMYLMILLANYTVYSMSANAAIAATSPPLQGYGVEQVSFVEEDHNPCNQNSDLSIVRTLRLSSLTNGGKTASVGGNNGGGGGGGGKYRPLASGTDGGDGRFDESDYDGVSSSISSTNPSRTSVEESVVSRIEEEETLCNSVMEEATEMQAASREEALDLETIERFVSPMDAKIETDQHSEHFKTELLYQTELAQQPNNPLLLANYAQFLYLAQDFDRAEEYFKRATKVESESKDAEALNKYANFLWLARNDLWAAEETYLEAISAEPDNSYYAANYAHFLWNTGGEDTCFPLTSSDSSVDV